MRFNLVPFEERILLDAAGAASITSAYDVEQSTDQAQHQAQQQDQADIPGVVSGNNDAVDGRILVISSQVADHALLSDAVKDGVTVITYDFNTSLSDLAQAIADKASGKEISSIGFALMGADGQFAITADTMMSVMANVSDFSEEVQGFWSSMGNMVKTGGSIDILSCDVGINVSGLQLLHQIDLLVQGSNFDHDIAVNISTDKTGASFLGGNWTLELSSMEGKLQVSAIDAVERYFDSTKIAEWDGLLDAPFLVKNIDSGLAVSSNPHEFVQFGDKVAFVAATSSGGTELWISDGTEQGTRIVQDLANTAQSSNPHDLVVVNNDLYFIANNQVYVSDGNSAQVVFNDSVINTSVDNLVANGSRLFFSSQADGNFNKYAENTFTGQIQAFQVWMYDTSNPSAGPISILDNATTASDAYNTVAVTHIIQNGPSTALFTISAENVTVRNSDGAITGYQVVFTERVYSVSSTGIVDMSSDIISTYSTSISSAAAPQSVITNLDLVDGVFYITKENGSTQTASVSTFDSSGNYNANVITNSIAGVSSFSEYRWNGFSSYEGSVYFTSDNGGLWSLSGGNVTNIIGASSSVLSSGQISDTFAAGGKFYFAGGAQGLYVINQGGGSPQQIFSGAVMSEPLVVGSNVYFSGTSVAGGTELWVTDGTIAETRQVADINSGAGSSDPNGLALVGGKIYFSATNSSSVGNELWAFDVNNAPVGGNKTYNGTEDTTLNVTDANGVLQGASDPDGNAISAILVSNGTKGVVTLNTDGSFSYVPGANQNGTDTFSYQLRDQYGALSPIYTATLNVAAVNDAPVAQNGTSTTAENAPLSGTVTAADIDSSNLTYTLASGPANGTLTLNADGTYTYTPGANYSGADSFTYRASDGSLNSNDGVVNITVTQVNDAPVGLPKTYNGIVGGTTAVDAGTGLLAGAIDPEGDAMTVSLVRGPVQGSVSLNSDGSFVYNPSSTRVNGTDSFTYVIRDSNGAVSNLMTAKIVLNSPDAQQNFYSTVIFNAGATVEGGRPVYLSTSTLIFSGSIAYIGIDTGLRFNIVTPPAHGIVVARNQDLYYVADLNYTGSDSFTFQGNKAGGLYGNIATYNLNVLPNDAPVGTVKTYSSVYNTSLTVAAANGLLGGATDPEGDAITATLISGGSKGTVTLNGNGSFTYIPNTGATGTDTFTYRLVDALGAQGNIMTATINIDSSTAPVNAAPVANNTGITTLEDTPVSGAVSAIDIDTPALTYTIVQGPAHGTLTFNSATGEYVYSPFLNYYGSDSFSFRANDGAIDSNVGVVDITVSSVNDAPVPTNPTLGVAEDDSLTISDSLLGSDVEGDLISISITNPPVHGSLTIQPDGSVVYTPVADYNGPDSFNYRVNDGSVSSVDGVINIVVTPMNDAPVALSPTILVTEDTPASIMPAQLGTDIDGNPLLLNIVSPPEHGILQINSNGTVVYTPNANYYGNDTFSYILNDGTTDSGIGVVTFVVTPVNDAPEVISKTITIPEGTTMTMPVDQLGTDVDRDHLLVVITQPPSQGTILTNVDGSITYIPNPNYSGVDSFTYTLSDGILSGNQGTASIVVSPRAQDNTPAPQENDGKGTFVIPPPAETGGEVEVRTPDEAPAALDPVVLGDPIGTSFVRDLSDYNIKILSVNPEKMGLEKIQTNVEREGVIAFEEGGGIDRQSAPKISQDDAMSADGLILGKGYKDSEGGDAGRIYYDDDLSRLLFFLGPISEKADYIRRTNLGNLFKTRKRELFRYREKRKIKKLSDLIEFLGLADLSFKRESKAAVQTENLNSIQRSTLEKNLDSGLFGKEYLNHYISELSTLSQMVVDAKQFPIVEALAVELLTKYIAAQELVEGTKIPFPILNISHHSSAAEYTVTGVFSLGSSEIPIYLLNGNNLPPLLVFRGTKLGLKKVSEVRSIIENLNSKGPARTHYNNFLSTIKAFFEEWFKNAPKSKKFRLFGYSQGGVLAQRTLIDFPQYVQTSDKYPSIFFNSPGVEEDYYKKWGNIVDIDRPAAINYVTTGDVVSKIGTGFVGEVYEINPKDVKDILESHYGMKFLEEDWRLYRVDTEAETKSETRAMLNAIQASFLTTEVYKIASAGLEKLYAHPNKGFHASNAIKTIETQARVMSPEPMPKPSETRLGLLAGEKVLNSSILSGQFTYIDTSINKRNWAKDAVMDINMRILKKEPNEIARMNLMESITKSAKDAVGGIDTTTIDYKAEAPIHQQESPKTKLLDRTYEPDFYSHADVTVAALVISEDLREMIPDYEIKGYKVLDAVKEEGKIDHTNI